jgi:predicted enzyme related to lactoylglutathione lyase
VYELGDTVNFNSLLIGSEDPQRLVEYYSKLLGKPAFEGDGFASWQIGSGWVSVGPHDEVHGKNAQPGRILWNIETADVPGEFDRFKAAGATVVREPYTFGDGSGPSALIATFSDPDDNYFQLMTPMNMEQS